MLENAYELMTITNLNVIDRELDNLIEKSYFEAISDANLRVHYYEFDVVLTFLEISFRCVGGSYEEVSYADSLGCAKVPVDYFNDTG